MEQKISIIAIHGNGGGGFRFDLAKPLFPSNINFLNPTLPGFNVNSTQTNNFSMREYSEWLANYLKDIQPPCILMGHGLGGVFVLEFLQHYPEMVDGVILHSIVGANLNKRVFPKVMKLPFVAWLTKNIIAHPITRPIISRKFLYSRGWDFTLMQKSTMNFNRYSGWFIGSLLSTLPRRLCFFFHYMAEKQAANSYNDLMISIENIQGMQWVNSSNIKIKIQC